MRVLSVRLLLSLFLLSSCSMLLWHYISRSNADLSVPQQVTLKSTKSKENAGIDKLLENYDTKWQKQEENIKSVRSSLGQCCNAISNLLVTQENTPLGTTITFDAAKKKLSVTPALFNVLPKENPFKTPPWDTCAVVGNGGILANSSCGKQIDSASFVIRCNLPPLKNEYEKHTGSKTSLVTANPSILFQKYRGLNRQTKQKFVEAVELYGDALLLMPAFSIGRNTGVSLRAHQSLQNQSNSVPQVVFTNPIYLRNLAQFWRGRGIRASRLSTGIMMVSLALEVCKNIHLYGFWPYAIHPYTYQQLTNHYYDDKQVNRRAHKMPAEFRNLLNLHNQGVIHLHLGQCPN